MPSTGALGFNVPRLMVSVLKSLLLFQEIATAAFSVYGAQQAFKKGVLNHKRSRVSAGSHNRRPIMALRSVQWGIKTQAARRSSFSPRGRSERFFAKGFDAVLLVRKRS